MLQGLSLRFWWRALYLGCEVSELFEVLSQGLTLLYLGLFQCVRFLNALMVCVPRFNSEVFRCLCSG